VGLTTTPWKRLVTKSEEAIAGYISSQKLLRKARADDDEYGSKVTEIVFCVAVRG
jgi:hypothetical protein